MPDGSGWPTTPPYTGWSPGHSYVFHFSRFAGTALQFCMLHPGMPRGALHAIASAPPFGALTLSCLHHCGGSLIGLCVEQNIAITMHPFHSSTACNPHRLRLELAASILQPVFCCMRVYPLCGVGSGDPFALKPSLTKGECSVNSTRQPPRLCMFNKANLQSQQQHHAHASSPGNLAVLARLCK